MLPEVRPGLAEPSAEKDFVMADCAVHDAISVRKVAKQFTGRKAPIQEIAIDADHDDRLGRWIAVPAQPIRIHPADGRGQAISRTIELDAASLAYVARQNAQRGALLYGQSIANLATVSTISR